MELRTTTIERSTTADTDILDLSGDVEAFVNETGVREGWVMVFVPGSTGAVTTIEFESGAINDLKRAIEQIAPRDGEYEHNLRWGDGNGYSHVRAALMGPSLVLPISEGRVQTGTWQQIVLCDYDNRPRQRRIQLQVLGAP
jgi:secondary thiamine-phosphate synthase enzyme